MQMRERLNLARLVALLPIALATIYFLAFLFYFGFSIGIEVYIAYIPITFVDLTITAAQQGGLFFGFMLITQWMIHSRITHDVVARMTPRHIRRVRIGLPILYGLAFAASLIWLFPLVPLWFYPAVALATIVAILYAVFFSTPTEIWNDWRAYICVLVIPLAVCAFSIGRDLGRYEARYPAGIVSLNNDGLNSFLVAQLDRGVIARAGSPQIQFIPWERVEKIDYFGDPALFRGNLFGKCLTPMKSMRTRPQRST